MGIQSTAALGVLSSARLPSRVTTAMLMIATPSAAAIAIGACWTRLRASAISTKSDVARAIAITPDDQPSETATDPRAAGNARRRRERRTHLLPVARDGDANRTRDGQRKHDQRLLRERGDRLQGGSSNHFEQRGEPGNRRRDLPARSGHHHETEDGTEENELQQRAHRCGRMRADDQHEQSPDDDERAEDEDSAANGACQVSRKVAKHVPFGAAGDKSERQARRDVHNRSSSDEKRCEGGKLGAHDRARR